LNRVDQSVDICKAAYDKVVALMGSVPRQIYRGNPTIPDGSTDHDAQTRIGGARAFTHIDDDYLISSSLAGLAELLLHEAWHHLNYETHPQWDPGPYYVTWPYSESQRCVF
jgi:hypothetical protein